MPPIDRQIVTVDIVLLSLIEQRLHVGLLKREAEPFKDRLALVGGYVHADKDRDTTATAERVLVQKSGLTGFFLEQLATFSGPMRDPRGWSVSVAYFALTPWSRLQAALGEAPSVTMVPVEAVPPLPFDHGDILAAALERLRSKGAYSTLPARLLDDTFTLSELLDAYRVALDVPRIDKSSFRRKLAELGLVEPVAGERAETGGRQAQLYRTRQGMAVFDRKL